MQSIEPNSSGRRSRPIQRGATESRAWNERRYCTAVIRLRLRRAEKHVGIFSITGGGKTNVAQILVLGLLEHNVPFLVVDWKRSYRALYTLAHPKVRNIRIYSVGRKTASSFNWNPRSKSFTKPANRLRNGFLWQCSLTLAHGRPSSTTFECVHCPSLGRDA